MAIDRADVCVIMIDAQDGITDQDTKIAGYAHEKGKASIIAVNKWDLIEKDDKTMAHFQEKLIWNWRICPMPRLFIFRQKRDKGSKNFSK